MSFNLIAFILILLFSYLFYRLFSKYRNYDFGEQILTVRYSKIFLIFMLFSYILCLGPIIYFFIATGQYLPACLPIAAFIVLCLGLRKPKFALFSKSFVYFAAAGNINEVIDIDDYKKIEYKDRFLVFNSGKKIKKQKLRKLTCNKQDLDKIENIINGI